MDGLLLVTNGKFTSRYKVELHWDRTVPVDLSRSLVEGKYPYILIEILIISFLKCQYMVLIKKRARKISIYLQKKLKNIALSHNLEGLRHCLGCLEGCNPVGNIYY